MKVTTNTKKRWAASAAMMPASPAGSRQGYWMDTCPVHGLTSFNTIIDGCEQCAAKRLAEKDKKDANA